MALSACAPAEAGGGAPAGPPPMPVRMETVHAATIRETSEYVAMLRSRRSFQVRPQVAGYVTRIVAAAGDKVRAGAALVQIDPARQRANVSSQRAERQANGAALIYWRGQRQRLARLVAAGAASRQELEQAESALRQAEANVSASRAQVAAQTVELRYYSVTALASGTVGDVSIRVGDYVTPETLLTTVDDNDVLEAYVDVPVERAARLGIGTPVDIVDERGAVLAPSAVTFISARASMETQTLLVKTHIDNAAGRLHTSQLVRARVLWGERAGLVIPVLAVQNRNGQSFAWVARPAGGGAMSAEPRAVQLGSIQKQSYPVVRGLSAGETVIVSGVQKLRPGARVVEAKEGGGADGGQGGGEDGGSGD